MEGDGDAHEHRGGSAILAIGTGAAAHWGHSWVGKGPGFIFFFSLVAAIL